MMPVIRVSQRTYERLQKHARPFEDKPEDVINVALDVLEAERQFVPVAAKPVQEPQSRNDGSKTPQKQFRFPLLTALHSLGGRGHVSKIREALLEELSPSLRTGDLTNVSTGEPRWWNAVCWERNNFVKEGLIRGDSPRGVWELTDQGKRAANVIKRAHQTEDDPE